MRISILLVALSTALVLSACSSDRAESLNKATAGGSAAGAGKAVAVVLDQAREEKFPYEIEALGTANANESIFVTAKVSNLVTAIRFREGQTVKRGDILLELDGVEVGAELASAQAALAESRSQYKRSQELLATQALSQSALDQIEATFKANQARVTTAASKVRDTVIRAPFDGRVGLRRVSVGSWIGAGTTITTLDDTSIIKLDFSVPENFISILREGMTITASSVAFKNREFTGTVASIDSRVDPTTRSVVTRALIANKDGALKPGMFLTVRLQQPRDRVVMISEQALVPEEGQQFVFVVKNNQAEKRVVSIGRRKPGRVEILSGLAAGETVVSEGTQSVRDGGRVQAVMQGRPGQAESESGNGSGTARTAS